MLGVEGNALCISLVGLVKRGAMGHDAPGRVLLVTGVVLVALMACKKKSGDTAAAASQSAAPPAAPAQSIAPATEPSAAATASASAAAAAPAAPTAAPAATTAAAAHTAATTTATASAAPAKTPVRAVNTTYQSIQRCCNALAAAAKKPGLKHNQYKSAAAVCAGIAAQAKKGAANAAAARTTIRAQLHGVPVPGGC